MDEIDSLCRRLGAYLTMRSAFAQFVESVRQESEDDDLADTIAHEGDSDEDIGDRMLEAVERMEAVIAKHGHIVGARRG